MNSTNTNRMIGNFFIQTTQVFILLFAVAVSSAQAATLTVTKLEDTNDGVCNSDCSLREAIAVAASGDTVVMQFGPSRTITLTNGASPSARSLVINKNLTVTAPNNLITIQAGGVGWRVFNITGAGVTVNLNNLIISGSKTNNSVPTLRFNGGGINANGGATLNMTGCQITGNTAVLGGGLFVDGGTTVNLTGSTVSGNFVDYDFASGAGIHNEGILHVTDSIISGNYNEADSGFNGGGIFNVGTLTMSRSTVSGNTNFARSSNTGNNGGVFNQGVLTVTNSTFSGNINIVNSGIANSDNGGGIWTNGNTTITN